MPTLSFALAQMDFPVGAVAANASRMRDQIASARDRGAALIAFPELTISGYRHLTLPNAGTHDGAMK